MKPRKFKTGNNSISLAVFCAFPQVNTAFQLRYVLYFCYGKARKNKKASYRMETHPVTSSGHSLKSPLLLTTHRSIQILRLQYII